MAAGGTDDAGRRGGGDVLVTVLGLGALIWIFRMQGQWFRCREGCVDSGDDETGCRWTDAEKSAGEVLSAQVGVASMAAQLSALPNLIDAARSSVATASAYASNVLTAIHAGGFHPRLEPVSEERIHSWTAGRCTEYLRSITRVRLDMDRRLAGLPELIGNLQPEDDHAALEVEQRKLPVLIKYVQRLQDDMQWLITLLVRQRSLFNELNQLPVAPMSWSNEKENAGQAVHRAEPG